MAAVRLVITGKVQGVFFRARAKEEADRLGIRGWVKNRDDGTVEIVAEGIPGTLEQFVDWCGRGPPEASVTGVERTAAEDQNFTGFSILH